MSVWQGADAGEILGQNAHGLARHAGLHDLEDRGRKMGEIGQGLVLDLPVLPIGPAQKGRRVDFVSHHSFRCDHMTGSVSARHEIFIA